MEPPLEPMTRSGLMPASSSTLSTPMCAKPRGPPDPSTRATRGAGPCGGSKRGRRSFGTSPMLQPAMPSARPARRMNGGALMLVAVLARLLLPARASHLLLPLLHFAVRGLLRGAALARLEEAADSEVQKREQQMRGSRCSTARRELDGLKNARRFYKIDAKGERVYVEDAERPALIERWEQEARKYCD